MPGQPDFPRYIFGFHDPGGEYLMTERSKQGWIVFTHELGHDRSHRSGFDYRPWTNRGLGAIARLNHGYGTAGTIPLPQHYDPFAERVRNWVQNSHTCHVWIIGNEMNHGQERPEGQTITPYRYAACYIKCWDQIHALPGHQDDQVVIGAVAPWNNTTAYPSNDNGDWVTYFTHIIRAIRNLGRPIDAIALHAYTHGHDPSLVFSEQRMNPPFQNRRFQFRCYRDFMEAIPQDMRHLPVYITEANEDVSWENVNLGWVQNAYREINDWNTAVVSPGSRRRANQQIRALVLYRWPKIDRWHIQGKTKVHDDFRAALGHEYTWEEVRLPRRLNGHLVQDGFLDFFDEHGQAFCGLPISDEVVENGLKTQYFERLILQEDPSGSVVLKAAGIEVQALRDQVHEDQARIRALESEIDDLQARVQDLETQLGSTPQTPGEPEVEIRRPMWDNVVYSLHRHPTDRYPLRKVSAASYLVISHSAVPTTLGAPEIAKFHVKHMHWPGIGYHFYIDGVGRISKTNELTTVCYHVGERDPISVGICVGGNFTRAIPTPAQLRSTGHLLAWLLQELSLPLDAIRGKKEFIDTQSPGLQWLSGKRWKDLLLAEVKRAQVEMAKPHPPKPFYHYLLFWQNADSWAEEDWRDAKRYIGQFRVTHGFSVDDARVSRYVTIVGGAQGVDAAAEQALIEAGCRVERLSGRTRKETTQILTEMAERGQRLLNYEG